MSMEVMREVSESIVVMSILCGSETWVMNARCVSHLEYVETRCLRAVCGVTRYDRIKNERIWEQVGVQMRLGVRAEPTMLRWMVTLNEWERIVMHRENLNQVYQE